MSTTPGITNEIAVLTFRLNIPVEEVARRTSGLTPGSNEYYEALDEYILSDVPMALAAYCHDEPDIDY